MAKLSVEIPEGRAEQMEVNVRIEGSGQELLCCLGYLAHTVANDMDIPVQVLLGAVVVRSSKIQNSILVSHKINLGAVEAAMEGWRGK